jgi:hypothetical protein
MRTTKDVQYNENMPADERYAALVYVVFPDAPVEETFTILSGRCESEERAWNMARTAEVLLGAIRETLIAPAAHRINVITRDEVIVGDERYVELSLIPTEARDIWS